MQAMPEAKPEGLAEMKKAPDPLKKIFGGNPCASFESFDRAVSVAERLPEDCRIVWQSKPQWGTSYRVARYIEHVIPPEGEPKSCFTRVWENGTVLIPENQHGKKPVPVPSTLELAQVSIDQLIYPSNPSPKVAGVAVSIPALIEALKEAGLSAEKILEVLVNVMTN
jgi:hypothetical protein